MTITNHNNARSCWDLLDKGRDVLVGAEFTVAFPEHDTRIHVLTYGFNPTQEARLNELRDNAYDFAAYTMEQDLVTVAAHPLFFETRDAQPSLDLVERLTLLFDNFEVINGQRDTRQNLLVSAWLESLDEEQLTEMSRRHSIPLGAFCRRPLEKGLTGGSDCHMSMFVGTTGTRVFVQNLSERLKDTPASQLVLEALREGRLAPWGTFTGSEKLQASILDFVCQAATKLEDPGLLRLLLHRGDTFDKITALTIVNIFFELRRHKYTSRFLRSIHNALQGRRPSFMMKRSTGKRFRPLVKELDRIAIARRSDPDEFLRLVADGLPMFFNELNRILVDRVLEKVSGRMVFADPSPAGTVKLIENLEVPANFRALLAGDHAGDLGDMSKVNLADWFDGLPFPLFGALVLGGASFVANKVMHERRAFANEFARRLGKMEHPQRALWLTDTFHDRNGVATVLRLMLDEVRRRDLPIDFLICSKDAKPEDHLVVLPPLAEFTTPLYPEQPVRVFDLLELQKTFDSGGYDRVICSTEMLTGAAGLYLKQAFNVPAYFYLHTDWLDFAQRTLRLDEQNLDRLRRLARAYYGKFDGIFVLNSEQREWLSSDRMGIAPERIHATAHWAGETFKPLPVLRESVIPGIRPDEPVVLFAGRVSEEKGTGDLPSIMKRIGQAVPSARLVVAGVGPAIRTLKAQIPDAIDLGWLDPESLARVYCAADVLLMPSRFDTFSCVVLEALSCGLPVVAYPVKGPRDIVEEGVCGFHAENPTQMALGAVRILTDKGLSRRLRHGALLRARDYEAETIVDELLDSAGLPHGTGTSRGILPQSSSTGYSHIA